MRDTCSDSNFCLFSKFYSNLPSNQFISGCLTTTSATTATTKSIDCNVPPGVPLPQGFCYVLLENLNS